METTADDQVSGQDEVRNTISATDRWRMLAETESYNQRNNLEERREAKALNTRIENTTKLETCTEVP